MSLRDFNTPSNDERPISLNNEPLGNGSGLGNFHTVNPEDVEPNNTPKIIGGLAVALMLGAAGAYIYSVSGHQPKQVVAANALPAPAAPMPAAAPAPMPAPEAQPAATAPASDATPAPMPAADTAPVSKPTPVRQASVTRAHSSAASSSTPDLGASNARMQADSQPAVQPQQQAAVTAPVEPVSPQAPASAQANNEPSQVVAPQQAQSSTPQADNAAPAQDQQAGNTPAPATTPAQPAQTTQQ